MKDNLIKLFNLGMKKEYKIEKVLNPKYYKTLNLGPGKNIIKHCINLDYPEWDAEKDPIPYGESMINQVFAFHFFEHLSHDGVVSTLNECCRVLVPGGIIHIVVPYYNSNLQFSDLDHKTEYTERTFRNLLSEVYYSKSKIANLELKNSIIMGDTETNLCLASQIKRKA